MPEADIELDVDGFVAMCDELAKISGKTFEEIAVYQVGRALSNCIRHTPARTAAAIIKRVSRHNNYIQFAGGEVVSYWKGVGALMFLDTSNWRPEMGRATKKRAAKPPPKLIGGKSWHQMDGERWWSPERWARWLSFKEAAEKQKKDPRAAVKARGLAKQSWLQIADDLGVDVDAPGYVESAEAPGGRKFKEGLARRLGSGAIALIEISNANPLIVGKLNGAQILQRSLDARTAAFEIETKKGVFSDMETRAKRYPGIFTV